MTNILTTLSASHVAQAIIVGTVLTFSRRGSCIMNVVLKAVATTTVNGWSATT